MIDFFAFLATFLCALADLSGTLTAGDKGIGTKTEREFRKNSIVRSAEIVGFDLDTKLYTLEWEEQNEIHKRKTIIWDER